MASKTNTCRKLQSNFCLGAITYGAQDQILLGRCKLRHPSRDWSPEPNVPPIHQHQNDYRYNYVIIEWLACHWKKHFVKNRWFLWNSTLFYKKCRKARVGSMQRFSEGHLPPQVVFHHGSFSIKDRLPPKVIFHWRSSSTKGRLPPKVVFHQRSSSTVNIQISELAKASNIESWSVQLVCLADPFSSLI